MIKTNVHRFFQKHEKTIKNIYLIAAAAFFGGTVLNFIGLSVVFNSFLLFTLVSPVAAVIPAAVLITLGVALTAYAAKGACDFYGNFDAFFKSLTNFRYDLLKNFK